MRTQYFLPFMALLCLFNTAKSQILTGGVDEEKPYADAGYVILDCSNDHQGISSLTDLAGGTYLGFDGGLFPGGTNTDPSAHVTTGKNISKNIYPLDASDNVSYTNGEIVFLGMGPSVAGDAFNEWKTEMNNCDWAGVNKCLNVKSCFIGGKTMTDMLSVDDSYWDTFMGTLSDKGINPNHVQVAWLLLQSDVDTNDVDAYVTEVSNEYVTILHNFMTYLPNLKEVFLSGIHYTGYIAIEHERYPYMIEPFGYWGNLAVKDVISRQINGDSELIPDGVSRTSPFITWGPYFWADGVNARADGLSWPCDNFRDDSVGGGFHLKDEYKYKEGNLFTTFLTTNSICKPWYKNATAWAACPGIMRHLREDESEDIVADEDHLQIFPVPAADHITITVPVEFDINSDLRIYSSTGELVFYESFDGRTSIERTLDISKIPSGIYYTQLSCGEKMYSGRFVKEK